MQSKNTDAQQRHIKIEKKNSKWVTGLKIYIGLGERRENVYTVID